MSLNKGQNEKDLNKILEVKLSAVENMNELLLLKSVLENLFVHKSCITIN
jgi:hypothetical protein